MPDKPLTAADIKASLGDEYGQYVAIVPIDFGTARAFNVGDPVPVEHVEKTRKVASSQVRKVATKAGQAAIQTQEK